MAYMSQDKKKEIAAELKKVVAKYSDLGVKYSLSVHNHSTIVMTIRSANVDFIENYIEQMIADDRGEYGDVDERAAWLRKERYTQVNHYYVDRHFTGRVAEFLTEATRAMNTGNFDKSDWMTDYHHVGHYVEISIGRWSKPFVVTETEKVA